jgi:hypothetical protein
MTKPCHKASKVQRIEYLQSNEAPEPWVGPIHGGMEIWEQKIQIPFILSHPVENAFLNLVFPPLSFMHACTLLLMLAYKISIVEDERF